MLEIQALISFLLERQLRPKESPMPNRSSTASRFPLLVLVAFGLASVGGPPEARAESSFKLNRVVWVRATGTPEENCQSLRDVLNSITDSRPADETPSNPYQVHLEPGQYRCGDDTVFVPQGVALVGASPLHTLILGEVDDAVLGVVNLVDGGAIVGLRIDNTGASNVQGCITVSVLDFAEPPRVLIRDSVLNGLCYVDLGEYSLWSQGAILIQVWNSDLEEVYLDDANLLLAYSTMISLTRVNGAEARCLGVTDFDGDFYSKTCQPPP